MYRIGVPSIDSDRNKNKLTYNFTIFMAIYYAWKSVTKYHYHHIVFERYWIVIFFTYTIFINFSYSLKRVRP